MKKIFPSIKQKFAVLPNLTSSELIRQMSEEYLPEEFDGSLTILSIGRLSEQKGFDLAISAAKILKEDGLKFKWLVLGDGELKEQLDSQILQAQVNDCFYLLGAKENPYVYIKNCDVFVQTSRFEGKSVVLDEAKILAKPILVTNYPTVRDQITNDQERLIVGLSAVEIAAGLKTLMSDYEARTTYCRYLQSGNYDNAGDIQKYYELMAGGE